MKHQALKHLFVWLLIAVHVVMISGCAVTNVVTLNGNGIPVDPDFKITTVILKDGEIVEFDFNGGRYVDITSDGASNSVIVGMVDDKNIEIAPEKVLEVTIEKTESSGSGNFIAGLLIGVPVGAAILYLIAVLSFSGH